jgi:hypothetical protein
MDLNDLKKKAQTERATLAEMLSEGVGKSALAQALEKDESAVTKLVREFQSSEAERLRRQLDLANPLQKLIAEYKQPTGVKALAQQLAESVQSQRLTGELDLARSAGAGLAGVLQAAKSLASVQLQLEKRIPQYAVQFQQAQSSIAGSARMLLGPVATIADALHQASELARNRFVEPLEQLRRSIEAFPTFAQGIGVFAAEALKKMQAEWDEEERKAFSLFKHRGFVGLERYLTRRQVQALIALSENKKPMAIDKHVFELFRQKDYKLLDQMVGSWWTLPYMKKRRRNIQAAIDAHKRGEFTLAIPALLPLIDGLAAEVVQTTATKPAGRRAYVKTIVKMHVDDSNGERAAALVEYVFNSLIYADYDFSASKMPPSSVNRHGILHGRVVRYASELNSYRVLFFLNFVAQLARKKLPAPKK